MSSCYVRIADPPETSDIFCYNSVSNTIQLSNTVKEDLSKSKVSDELLEGVIEDALVHEYIHFVLDRDMGEVVSISFDAVIGAYPRVSIWFFPLSGRARRQRWRIRAQRERVRKATVHAGGSMTGVT